MDRLNFRYLLDNQVEISNKQYDMRVKFERGLDWNGGWELVTGGYLKL